MKFDMLNAIRKFASEQFLSSASIVDKRHLIKFIEVQNQSKMDKSELKRHFYSQSFFLAVGADFSTNFTFRRHC